MTTVLIAQNFEGTVRVRDERAGRGGSIRGCVLQTCSEERARKALYRFLAGALEADLR